MEQFLMVMTGVLAFLIAVPWILILMVPLTVFLAPIGLPALGLVLLLGRGGAMLSSTARRRILIADDDEISIAPLLTALSQASVDVLCVSSGKELLRAIRKQSFDLLFLDLFMPGLNGEDVLTLGERYTQSQDPLPVVVYTGSHERSLRLEKRHYGRFQVDAVWEKNMRYQELCSRLQQECHVSMGALANRTSA